ncbi:MAG: hypothetical protein BWY65_01913 [Firmicutes bacterium ADurb.Bin373]|nr:MAG: hypothetical protein BWY65_01913 [Firmicutes bacterium ADurb.Bin373]
MQPPRRRRQSSRPVSPAPPSGAAERNVNSCRTKSKEAWPGAGAAPRSATWAKGARPQLTEAVEGAGVVIGVGTEIVASLRRANGKTGVPPQRIITGRSIGVRRWRSGGKRGARKRARPRARSCFSRGCIRVRKPSWPRRPARRTSLRRTRAWRSWRRGRCRNRRCRRSARPRRHWRRRGGRS